MALLGSDKIKNFVDIWGAVWGSPTWLREHARQKEGWRKSLSSHKTIDIKIKWKDKHSSFRSFLQSCSLRLRIDQPIRSSHPPPLLFPSPTLWKKQKVGRKVGSEVIETNQSHGSNNISSSSNPRYHHFPPPRFASFSFLLSFSFTFSLSHPHNTK